MIGLKLWSISLSYIPAARRLFDDTVYDFLELLPVPGSLDKIPDWQSLGIPLGLHAPHSYFEFILSRRELREKNHGIVREMQQWVEAVKPLYVIFHPGLGGTAGETIEQIGQFREEFPCVFTNALIENKPKYGIGGQECRGSSPDEIARIMRETGLGFCLDFSHAVCYAAAENLKSPDVIDEFMALKPALFHIADGHLASFEDEHLNLGHGEYDLDAQIARIPQNARVVIETKKKSKTELDDFAEDVRFLEGSRSRDSQAASKGDETIRKAPYRGAEDSD